MLTGAKSQASRTRKEAYKDATLTVPPLEKLLIGVGLLGALGIGGPGRGRGDRDCDRGSGLRDDGHLALGAAAADAVAAVRAALVPVFSRVPAQ